MSAKSLLKNSDTIPLSVAVTLVSYSRDYIGRLAREGKIVAEQIDREWFVSRQSLLNFAEHSSLEDSVKKKILSLSRKNDLEAKDFYTQKVATIKNRVATNRVGSVLATGVVMVGGLVSGFIFYTHAEELVTATPFALIETLRTFNTSQSANVVSSGDDQAAIWKDSVVVESSEALAMDGGIVLFPTLEKDNEETVETLFSDDVTVVVTSTTTGFVRSADGSTELPFVRVPQGTTF
jgi:hypothetical protein